MSNDPGPATPDNCEPADNPQTPHTPACATWEGAHSPKRKPNGMRTHATNKGVII